MKGYFTSLEVSLAGNFGQPCVLTAKDLQETTHRAGCMSLTHRKPQTPSRRLLRTEFQETRLSGFLAPCSRDVANSRLREGLRTLERAGALTVERWELRNSEDRQEPKQYYSSWE